MKKKHLKVALIGFIALLSAIVGFGVVLPVEDIFKFKNNDCGLFYMLGEYTLFYPENHTKEQEVFQVKTTYEGGVEICAKDEKGIPEAKATIMLINGGNITYYGLLYQGEEIEEDTSQPVLFYLLVFLGLFFVVFWVYWFIIRKKSGVEEDTSKS